MNTTYGVLNNSSLIVDTAKLRENVRTILRSLPAGTKLIPVVKDDAYGMGMVGVARTLSAFPEIGCFAVANVSEGVTLRREGIRQDILIMGSTLPFQYAPAVECDLTVTVSRLGMVPELAEVCKAQSKPLNVQIKLETGMHRIGVEQVLKPTLRSIPWEEMRTYPESFLLENCGRHQQMIDAVSAVLKQSE